MTESLADLLGQLRFVSGPLETIYLNERRTRDDFRSQLGAIESFTRGRSKQGDARLPFVNLGVGAGSQTEATWSLTDPTAQALVLRAALESQGLLFDLDSAEPGRYVQCTGRGLLSRPGTLVDQHRAGLASWPGLYEELEAERAKEEELLTVIGEGHPDLCWLMTVDTGTHVAAANLGNRWLSKSLRAWLGSDVRWNVFARFIHLNERGVPLLAAFHVTVAWA
jgi:hypothetical protein